MQVGEERVSSDSICALVENDTRVLFDTRMAGYQTGEITLAKANLERLTE